MISIIYIPTNKIKPNPNNLFPPLTKEEYESLKGSIKRNGIKEPLKVYYDNEEEDAYICQCGDNRLQIAIELGIKEVPCIIEKTSNTDVAIELELFRRHLPHNEWLKYRNKLKDNQLKVLLNEAKKRVIPELMAKYDNGDVTLETLKNLVDLPMDVQKDIYNNITRVVSIPVPVKGRTKSNEVDPAIVKLKKEIKKKDTRITILEEQLLKEQINSEQLADGLTVLKRELDSINTNLQTSKKELEAKINEYEKMKSVVGIETINEYKKEIEKLEKDIRDQSTLLNKKNEELEKTNAEVSRYQQQIKDKEGEVRAANNKLEEVKKIYNGAIKANPDALFHKLSALEEDLTQIITYVGQHSWPKTLHEQVKKINITLERKLNKLLSELEENTLDNAA